MPSDIYIFNIKAVFSFKDDANSLCDDIAHVDRTTIADLATACVILGKGIMSIQQARAVQGSLEI